MEAFAQCSAKQSEESLVQARTAYLPMSLLHCQLQTLVLDDHATVTLPALNLPGLPGRDVMTQFDALLVQTDPSRFSACRDSMSDHPIDLQFQVQLLYWLLRVKCQLLWVHQ